MSTPAAPASQLVDLIKSGDPQALQQQAPNLLVSTLHLTSPQDLILNLALGLIGTAYFLYGKKQGSVVPLICGLLMIIGPYVFTGFLMQLLLGLLLAAIPFVRR